MYICEIIKKKIQKYQKNILYIYKSYVYMQDDFCITSLSIRPIGIPGLKFCRGRVQFFFPLSTHQEIYQSC